MSTKHILITGGLGYVGSRLTPHLLQLGYEVSVIDLMLYGDDGLEAIRNNPMYSDWKNRFHAYQEDIRNPMLLEHVFEDVDTVIHLAAISNDPTGEIDEVLTRQVNFDAVGQLLCLAKKSGVGRFINASSSSVFGVKEAENISERLEPEPLTYYSKYKMLSEWLILTASSHDFCTVNIRPATICGVSPRQRFDLTVNKLTADAVTKRQITVHGGEQRRPNIGITDMINLYAQLIEIDSRLINGRTFNFGFENHKVIEIAKIIQEELADLNVKIEVTETFDHRDYHISSDKILNELNYQPASSIRHEVKMLRRFLEEGAYTDVDDKKYYNMQTMVLDRNASPYMWLSR